MTSYEWIATIFTLMAGFGSLIAWVFSQNRLSNVEAQAREANKIAHRALTLEIEKFKLTKLESLVLRFHKLTLLFSGRKVSDTNLKKDLLNDLHSFLEHDLKLVKELLTNQQIIHVSEIIKKEILEFYELSTSYQTAENRITDHGGVKSVSNLITQDNNTELQFWLNLKNSNFADMRRLFKGIIGKCNQLSELLKAEKEAALRNAIAGSNKI